MTTAPSQTPDIPEADPLFEAAVGHHRSGRLEQAERACEKILETSPDHPRALHLMGAIRYAMGDVDSGTDLVRRALASKPDYAEAHFNLGAMLSALNRPGDAAAHYGAAAKIKPDDIVAHVRFAAMLDAAGRVDEAIRQYRDILARWPDCLPALLDIASLYLQRGDTEQSIQFNQRAVRVAPDNAVAALRLGRALKQSGQRQAAIGEYRRSLALQPDNLETLNFLAVALLEHGALEEARTVIAQALTLRTDHAPSQFNAGLIAQAIGDVSGARGFINQALTLEPENPLYRRVSLATLLYDPDLPETTQAELHRRYGAWLTSRASPAPYPSRPQDPRGRLRIGWLSSDFRDHPVARNIEPILTHFDRSRFGMFLYGHVTAPDATTRRLQTLADGWRSVVGMNDGEVANRIREDGIDILVVLAGHFDHNRPEIAAWRAAPVQVSFHDPATSGMSSMDYLIADRRLVPRRGEEWFAERVLMLPVFYLHPALTSAPRINTLPVSRADTVTFGSFNNPAKINDSVLELWTRVLRTIPNSRLMLKYRQHFMEAPIRLRVERAARSGGVDPERFVLTGEREDRGDHLARYQDIDIALDPFPFSGSTTTFEALWMGVPVVTLAGTRMAARWSSAMLGALKRDGWIARTLDDYVRIATALAREPDRLAAVRRELRDHVASSPLCNENRRARQFERLMQAIWRKHTQRPVGRSAEPFHGLQR